MNAPTSAQTVKVAPVLASDKRMTRLVATYRAAHAAQDWVKVYHTAEAIVREWTWRGTTSVWARDGGGMMDERGNHTHPSVVFCFEQQRAWITIQQKVEATHFPPRDEFFF